MFLNLYRKCIFKLFDLYSPLRKIRAKRRVSKKKSLGYNKNYAENSIPLSEIAIKLKQAGVSRSDTIFIRTSASAARAFEGGIQSFLNELIEYITPDGNLVMSSYTFDKSPLMYLADNPVFDHEYSFDRMSLVGEIFRRMPGVLRSVHPTHSLCAYGNDAEWIVSEHHKSENCYSRYSPFAKIYDLNGKDISIGVFPTTISIHYIEQFLPKNAPAFRDMMRPVMCRLNIDGEEFAQPFKVQDIFTRYSGEYSIFNGTNAEMKKHYFGKYLDFHVSDLQLQLAAMKKLAADGLYWNSVPSKLVNVCMQYIVKPLVLKAYFEEVDGVLIPVKH